MAFERQDISIIGSNISKYRKLKKYTQKQLGDLIDVNPKTVSKWENGTVGPDITILKSLADALDVSVEELLTGIKNKNKKYKNSILLNIIFSFIVVILIGVVTFMYVNRYEVYEFKSNHEQFNIEGYVVSGRGESRFVFEDFSYITKARTEVLIKEIEIKFYVGDDLVHEANKEFDKKVNLSYAIGSLIVDTNIDFSIYNANFRDEFVVKIEYVDATYNKTNKEVNLKLFVPENEN